MPPRRTRPTLYVDLNLDNMGNNNNNIIIPVPKKAEPVLSTVEKFELEWGPLDEPVVHTDTDSEISFPVIDMDPSSSTDREATSTPPTTTTDSTASLLPRTKAQKKNDRRKRCQVRRKQQAQAQAVVGLDSSAASAPSESTRAEGNKGQRKRSGAAKATASGASEAAPASAPSLPSARNAGNGAVNTSRPAPRKPSSRNQGQRQGRRSKASDSTASGALKATQAPSGSTRNVAGNGPVNTSRPAPGNQSSRNHRRQRQQQQKQGQKPQQKQQYQQHSARPNSSNTSFTQRIVNNGTKSVTTSSANNNNTTHATSTINANNNTNNRWTGPLSIESALQLQASLEASIHSWGILAAAKYQSPSTTYKTAPAPSPPTSTTNNAALGHKSSNSNSSARTAIALDCEMIETTRGSECCKLCVVDIFTGNRIIDIAVEPSNPVRYWRTKYSGMSWRKMEQLRKQGKTVKGWQAARDLLFTHIDRDTIIVGQALHNDLNCLGISHRRVVDTALLTRAAVIDVVGRFVHRTWALKVLTWVLLRVDIQSSGSGHDCLEDALATREVLLFCLQKPRELAEWAKDAAWEVPGYKPPRKSAELVDEDPEPVGKWVEEAVSENVEAFL